MSKFVSGDFGKDEKEYERLVDELPIQTRVHYIVYCHGGSHEDMVSLPFYKQGGGGGDGVPITFEQLVDPGECLFSQHYNLFDLCRGDISPKKTYRSGDLHNNMSFTGEGTSMAIFKCFTGPDGIPHLVQVRLISEADNISLLDMIAFIYQYHRTNHSDISSFKIIFHTCRILAGSDVVISKPPIKKESPDELAAIFEGLGLESDEMDVDKEGGFAGINKKKIRKKKLIKFTKRKRRSFSKRHTKKYKKITRKYKRHYKKIN